jgi:purine-nucleoside phosphorylase
VNAALQMSPHLREVAEWRPRLAVVFGSGLAALPEGARLDAEVDYGALGWPCTTVSGHENRLRLAALQGDGGEVRVALACGRPHRYEGWSDDELERPVRGLAAAGAARLVVTNSCGALRRSSQPGDLVACVEVVDLQSPPAREEPERLMVCTANAARLVATALASGGPARVGVYVSVLGPQYETPAEVEWLACHGDVVGMSAAPEVRAAAAVGVECLLLAAVANPAGAATSHDDVLAAGGLVARCLAAGLLPAAVTRWPDLLGSVV